MNTNFRIRINELSGFQGVSLLVGEDNLGILPKHGRNVTLSTGCTPRRGQNSRRAGHQLWRGGGHGRPTPGGKGSWLDPEPAETRHRAALVASREQGGRSLHLQASQRSRPPTKSQSRKRGRDLRFRRAGFPRPVLVAPGPGSDQRTFSERDS